MKEMLGTVVGNNDLRMRIGSDVLAAKLPHALILEGQRGTGKHTVAKLASAALVCERKNNASAPLPCGECLSCRKVLENKSPDVITLGCQG